MLDPRMQDALNEQINAELFSAYLYLAMAAYFEAEDLPGFAHWMRVQAQEELEHAMKIFDFVNERKGRVHLAEIKAPKATWASPAEAFEDALHHEESVTQRIHNLVELARSLKDYATEVFLQWFVEEQVEEEATAEAVLRKVQRAKDHPPALLMLDRELGQRKPE